MSIEVLIEKDGQNFVVIGSKNLYEETYDGTRKLLVMLHTILTHLFASLQTVDGTSSARMYLLLWESNKQRTQTSMCVDDYCMPF